jgi:hypothetical protein
VGVAITIGVGAASCHLIAGLNDFSRGDPRTVASSGTSSGSGGAGGSIASGGMGGLGGSSDVGGSAGAGGAMGAAWVKGFGNQNAQFASGVAAAKDTVGLVTSGDAQYSFFNAPAKGATGNTNLFIGIAQGAAKGMPSSATGSLSVTELKSAAITFDNTATPWIAASFTGPFIYDGENKFTGPTLSNQEGFWLFSPGQATRFSGTAAEVRNIQLASGNGGDLYVAGEFSGEITLDGSVSVATCTVTHKNARNIFLARYDPAKAKGPVWTACSAAEDAGVGALVVDDKGVFVLAKRHHAESLVWCHPAANASGPIRHRARAIRSGRQGNGHAIEC